MGGETSALGTVTRRQLRWWSSGKRPDRHSPFLRQRLFPVGWAGLRVDRASLEAAWRVAGPWGKWGACLALGAQQGFEHPIRERASPAWRSCRCFLVMGEARTLKDPESAPGEESVSHTCGPGELK